MQLNKTCLLQFQLSKDYKKRLDDLTGENEDESSMLERRTKTKAESAAGLGIENRASSENPQYDLCKISANEAIELTRKSDEKLVTEHNNSNEASQRDNLNVKCQTADDESTKKIEDKPWSVQGNVDDKPGTSCTELSDGSSGRGDLYMKCQTEDEESMKRKRENELWSVQGNVNDISGTSSTQLAESSVKASMCGNRVYMKLVQYDYFRTPREKQLSSSKTAILSRSAM
ncbi:unnamed protein product [Calicophoron daubneyi]|uniref:Uncharacterized protein n=1 Tax=Calicophoron daubneyi TaxID=300641 RepID=A0AAV2SXH8_CALDB